MLFRNILIIVFLFCAPFSFSQEIEFNNGTWKDVLKLAKKQNKPIMVDAYTTWCGPCKWMAANTFTDAEVGAFVNKKFIAYKMDMEKGEGVQFALDNQVEAYPTILFFDSNGKATHRGVGSLAAKEFIDLCSDALNPEKQLSTLKSRFLAGEHEKAFLANYINVTMNANDLDVDALALYWPLLSDEEKLSEAVLEQMNYATNGFSEPNSDMRRQFIDHKKEYTQLIGELAMQQMRKVAYQGNIGYIIENIEIVGVDDALSALKIDFPEFAGEIVEFYNLSLAFATEDEDEMEAATKAYLGVTSDWMILNSIAWGSYENSDDQEELEYALYLINRSVELHAEYINLDTQAAVLFKLKRYSEAKKAVDLALNSLDGTESEADTESTKELKGSIEAAMKK